MANYKTNQMIKLDPQPNKIFIYFDEEKTIN